MTRPRPAGLPAPIRFAHAAVTNTGKKAGRYLRDDLTAAWTHLQQRLRAAIASPVATSVSLLIALATTALGFFLVVYPVTSQPFTDAGLQSLGPLLGIALIVFSLFGELPKWISWTQTVGLRLTPGIILGTLWLVLTNWSPTTQHESAFYAFSPRVWAAYLSIVLVSLSFELSPFPSLIYRVVKSRFASTYVIVPLYCLVVGLAGNLLDGVTIIAISAVIFFHLLDRRWALQASFALLFGGLISNLITVAAEPTNIKFQDSLALVLDRVNPSYWFMNWPISVIGMALPALWLGKELYQARVQWRTEARQAIAAGAPPAEELASGELVEEEISDDGEVVVDVDETPRIGWDLVLSGIALALLGAGIVLHAVIHVRAVEEQVVASSVTLLMHGLWVFLLPAGVIAVAHLLLQGHLRTTAIKLFKDSQTWIRLMAIFSLIWIASYVLTQRANVFAGFFVWPIQLRLPTMVVLSLASSITDNVALAGMQAALILNHPLPVWMIRLLFVLLCWAGGLTSFGCLQSLALHSRTQLSSREWFQQAKKWALITLVAEVIGVLAVILIYPGELGIPH